MPKPHLYFNNSPEGIIQYKSRKGGFDDKGDSDDKKEKDYRKMAADFSRYMSLFNRDIEVRHDHRTLELPLHFDLIQIDFFGAFDQPKYEGYYSDNYGLSLQHLSRFNRRGLFVIEKQQKIDHFFAQLQYFIDHNLNGTSKAYDGKIRYIKAFKLFSKEDMLGNIDNYSTIHLSLIGQGFVLDELVIPQKQELFKYLKESDIAYKEGEYEVELYDISEEKLIEIVSNFDIIYASCSGSGAIIQPDRYNAPKRDFGFEIMNPQDNLPIIGVIDTGISEQTPLKSILIGKNGDYDTTGTGSFIDNADHGTGVAAFAAFGNKLIPGYRGEVEADAKLLPIKISDAFKTPISQSTIVELIRRAHEEYNVRIFTLTIGYGGFPFNDNEEFSSYARMLDEITAELDILIFISTTNNNPKITQHSDYPAKFKESSANMAAPAESMNNITIGAIADNFEDQNTQMLSPSKEFPALYSRKFHYNFDDSDLFNNQTGNKYLRKPDVLFCGGDYTEYEILGEASFDPGSKAGIEVLSSNLKERTFFTTGTSYATPLAANLAARLLKTYPNLETQTIKAILINNAQRITTGDIFNGFSNKLADRIMGYGNLNPINILYSDDNKVTMVIEDEIPVGHIKSFPLHLPKFLNSAKNKKSLLKITATLCFKFQPKNDSQLLYCPLHVTYAICKNLPIEDNKVEDKINEDGTSRQVENYYGINGNSSKEIKLNSGSKGWVQDYYLKGKIVSNVQKETICVKRSNIIEEDNTFKIAINAEFHKLLSKGGREPYQNAPIPINMAITIEQFPLKDEKLSSLYDELILVNDLESIAEADIELTN